MLKQSHDRGGRRLGGLLFAVALALAATWMLQLLVRPLWYDEALTVLEYLSLPSYWAIYTTYTLPNNHILYTLGLRAWVDVTAWCDLDPVFNLRLFSLLLSGVTAWLFWRLCRRRLGLWPAYLATAAFTLSLPFGIYGTAVRGYMLAMLGGVLAVEAVLLLQAGRFRRGALLYLVAALLGIGSNPTHLLFFFAVSAGIFLGRVPTSWPRRFGLAVLPLAALLFYVGAGRQFLDLRHTHEGYIAPWKFIWHLYAGTWLAWLPLTMAGAGGAVVAWRHGRPAGSGGRTPPRRPWQRWRHLELALPGLAMPALLIALLRPSPLPRFFLVFLPLWLFVAGAGLRHLQAWVRLRKRRAPAPAARMAWSLALPLLLALVLGWARAWHDSAPQLTRVLTPAPMLDDLACPYYRRDFDPESVVAEVARLYRDNGDRMQVFVAADADPPSLLFYSQLQGLPEKLWLYDIPRQPVPRQAFSAAQRFLVTASLTHLEPLRQRFASIDRVTRLAGTGMQQLYEVRDAVVVTGATAAQPDATVRVAALQCYSRLGQTRENSERLSALITKAAGYGAKIIVLPECAVPGYLDPITPRLWSAREKRGAGELDVAAAAEPIPGRTTAHFAKLAQDLGVYLAVPLIEKADGKFYNAVVLLDPDGKLVAHHRKQNLWPPGDELWAAEGDRPVQVVDTPYGRLGLMICFEIHNLPETLAKARADIVLYAVGWFGPNTKDWFSRQVPQKYVKPNGFALVAANWAGDATCSGWPGQGYSCVIGRDGTVLAMATTATDCEIVIADLPLRMEVPGVTNQEPDKKP